MGISVVIPLYNKEKHIKRAINSVLDQNYELYEIIVVNDGSTDESLSKVEAFSDSRITIVNQINKGVSSARNQGIKISNYDLIAFLDADDTWKPHFLEEIAKLRTSHPDAGVYATTFEEKLEDGIINPIKIDFVPRGWSGVIEDYFKEAITNRIVWTSSVAVSKTALEKAGGFTVGMTRGEDLEVWIKVATEFKVAFSNIISSTYHKDSENMASKKPGEYNKSIVKVVEELYETYKNKNYASEYFKEYMIRLFITKAKYFIESGKNKEARSLLRKYKDTNFFKKEIIATYILSFMPNNLSKFLLNSNKIRNIAIKKIITNSVSNRN